MHHTCELGRIHRDWRWAGRKTLDNTLTQRPWGGRWWRLNSYHWDYDPVVTLRFADKYWIQLMRRILLCKFHNQFTYFEPLKAFWCTHKDYGGSVHCFDMRRAECWSVPGECGFHVGVLPPSWRECLLIPATGLAVSTTLSQQNLCAQLPHYGRSLDFTTIKKKRGYGRYWNERLCLCDWRVTPSWQILSLRVTCLPPALAS